MFRFAQPAYFLLLIPLAAAAWLVYRRHIRQGMIFSLASRLPASGTTWRTIAARILPAFSLLGIALSIAALARPQTVFSKTRRTADVIAIEMVVDASGTMDALDMSERLATGDVKERTRLDAVKEAFATFIGKRPDDLIGLITFGGFATSRAPLTADHQALLHILKGVQVIKTGLDSDGQMVNQEETLTAIGDALATACGRLERAGAKSRIIVLLTDGLSNTGIIKPEDAMKAAKKLADKGIHDRCRHGWGRRADQGQGSIRQGRRSPDGSLHGRRASQKHLEDNGRPVLQRQGPEGPGPGHGGHQQA